MANAIMLVDRLVGNLHKVDVHVFIHFGAIFKRWSRTSNGIIKVNHCIYFHQIERWFVSFLNTPSRMLTLLFTSKNEPWLSEICITQSFIIKVSIPNMLINLTKKNKNQSQCLATHACISASISNTIVFMYLCLWHAN